MMNIAKWEILNNPGYKRPSLCRLYRADDIYGEEKHIIGFSFRIKKWEWNLFFSYEDYLDDIS